jgi:hypothetical protein
MYPLQLIVAAVEIPALRIKTNAIRGFFTI